MKKILTGLASLTLAVGSIETAKAAVLVLDPTAGPASIYDQGGILNNPTGIDCSPASLPNIPTGTPFYMGGLEVAPDGSGVYVTQANNIACNDFDHPSTQNRLILSTGLGTASQIGPTLQEGNIGSFGNDLTFGPEGRYYIATNTGIWGFDPAGGPATRYASWQTEWTASGLTFSADGNTAIVSSDNPKGIFSIPRNSNIANIYSQNLVDNSQIQEAWDDHVVTRDGRILTMGDNASAIFEVLPGLNLQEVYEFPPSVRSFFSGLSYGSRGAVDPITGDIFYAVSFDTPSSPIVRIKSDFSSASIFATGFAQDLRDLDFGPSSTGGIGAISLYVSENNRATGVGTIYEISVGTTAVPEPSDTILCSIVVLGIGALFKRKLAKKPKYIKRKP